MYLAETRAGSQPSAADRAYAYVRSAILARELAPHELVTEGEVADAVGVSRTPVREALLRLQGDGFVRLLPKRGAQVLPVTGEEIADLMETRRLIEVFAVRRAIAGRSVRELVRKLDVRLGQMRVALGVGDTPGYVRADQDFHAEIVAATGNAVITSLYRSLRDRQLLAGVTNLLDRDGVADSVRMRATLHEHEAIRRAIAARRVRAAEAAVDAHLDRTEKQLGRRA